MLKNSTTTTDPVGLSQTIDTSQLGVIDWLVAGALIIGGFVFAMAARRLIARVFSRGSNNTAHIENLVTRVVQAAVVLLAMAYALGAIGVRVSPLLGALGIGGIALALALQPMLLNLFSGLVIHAQRPLRIGEEILTGDIQGRVVDVTSRAVVVLVNSGETIYIPNSVVVDREIVNLVRHGRRRTTLSVGVAYHSDLASARQVIETATKSVAGVLPQPEAKALLATFGESSIDFDVDYWHQADEASRRQTRDKVIESIHVALGDAGITIPFPQRTLWLSPPASDVLEPRTGSTNSSEGPAGVNDQSLLTQLRSRWSGGAMW